MDLVEDLADPEVPIALACEALGLSRATLYRQTQPPLPASAPLRAPSPRWLDDAECQALLDVLHSDEFVDQPPQEVHATLLTRGLYFASIRTMYRALAAAESGERRAQRAPIQHAKPTLLATAPNQGWPFAMVGAFWVHYVLFKRTKGLALQNTETSFGGIPSNQQPNA